MNGTTSRLVGLAASLGIGGFAIGTPAALLAIGAVPSASTFAWSSLTRPDDGTFALSLIAIIAWGAWITLTALLGLEIIARLRGVETVRVSGLTVPQRLASRAVAAASLLFLAVPAAASAVAIQQPAIAAELHAGDPSPPVSSPTAEALEEDSVSEQTSAADPAATRPYVVRRGDSLWKIAERTLGDGRRYVELVGLNADVLRGRPDFIAPGLVLNVPNDVKVQPETYVVKPGDTLSTIAETQLGAAERFPEIVEASRGTVQHDGRRLEDPDLIVPGWSLTMPSAEGSASRTPPPTEQEADGGQPLPDHRSGTDDPATDELESNPTPSWVLPGLTGAGALLAGSLLLTLRQSQRTQRRFRLPGHRMEPPPADLLNVEKTVHFSGTKTAPNLDKLDALLRTLADSDVSTPELAWAALDHDQVALHLQTPATLPEPWTGEGRLWTAQLDADIEPLPEALPPYPLLVSVGEHQDGRLCLVNLEPLACQSVTGPAEQVAAFARYVAAELALSPWSLLTDVTAIGVADELATIDPLRFHHRPHPDATFCRQFAADIDADMRLPGIDPDRYRVLIASKPEDLSWLEELADTMTASGGRSGTAVLVLNQAAGSSGRGFVLDVDGRLRIDRLGLSLHAAGLTSSEAAACASILEAKREAKDVPMPTGDWANDQLESFLDASGGIRPEFVCPRPEGCAGAASLLSGDTMTYVESAATTMEDVEALAPIPVESVRKRIQAADPRLDEDLHDWFSQSPSLPHLTLLGHVAARTRGDAMAVARRKPYYVELLAFLALHPHGVTAEEVSAATGASASRTRADLAALRAWLGRNPRTGKAHLPDARASRAAAERGVPCYQVDDVLTDLDLFRRLRARAQARGSEGIADLVTALGLVSAEPFSQLRPAGWTWLAEGERLDHILTCAIIDVAHLVTTHALAEGDLELARLAAQAGHAAAPDDEISRLDLVQVAAASGHAELAERQLIDGILNRSDDDRGPLDLPPRTRRIAGDRSSRSSARGSSKS